MSRLALALAFACSVFLLPSSAFASSVTGQLFGNSYLPIGPDQNSRTSLNERVQTPLQDELALWLNGDYDFTPTFNGHITATAEEIQPSVAVESEGFRLGVREAFVERFAKGFGVKIGRQILSWGKSDGINPTDYFSAFDYTVFNPDSEYQRLATNAVVFNYSPNRGRSPVNFTLVYVAVPPRTNILQFNTENSDSFRNVGDDSSATTFKTPEASLKVSYTGRGWDASVSSFIGQIHTPSFRPIGFTLTPQPSLTVNQYYQPVINTGADFSVAAGSWVLRGEAAYTYVRETDPFEDPLILPDHFDAVLGAERPIGDSFRFGVQAIMRYLPQFTPASKAQANGVFPAAVNQQLAAANQLIQGMQYQGDFGESLRAEYMGFHGFDFQMFLMHYEQRRDFLFRPLITYHWSDPFKVFVGLNDFSGPTDSPFGAFSVYNSVFAGGVFNF